ncbi:hypothetical protein GCM10025780_37070 [Frondihabitans cladoniiphilus]|uniref:Lactococcin 972 family bacteriocin n=2 Tax=Frondihabitans cladoniiphilus TaxID=715785 RepID=A0ABP8WCP2_9MICO
MPMSAQAAPVRADASASVTAGSVDDTQRGVDIPEGFSTRTVAHPEGGEWRYGIDGPGNTTYSHYLHSSRKHSSSVRNGNLEWFRSSVAGAGVQSRAAVAHTVGGNQSFYKFN